MMDDLPRLLSVARIQHRVASAFDVSMHDMISARRDRRTAVARHAAMYLARKLTRYSLPQIARCFDRDHTTVLTAIKACEGRMVRHAGLLQTIDRLENELRAPDVQAAEAAVQQAAETVAGEIQDLALKAFARDPAAAAKAVADALRTISSPKGGE